MRIAFSLLFVTLPSFAGHFRDFSAPSAPPTAMRGCAELLGGGVTTRSAPVAKGAVFTAPSHQRYTVREKFDALFKAVTGNEAELREILSEFNSFHGTDFELAQVKSMLKHGYAVEGWHLEHTRELASAAIYASTNVPLYTLIAHGVIPSMIAKDVWFRTPETTRGVYLKLYALLAKALPAGMIDALHILHESQDVQYDNFARMYVLGTNKKGTQIARDPADLVIFTGNPDTARRILKRAEEKLKERPAMFPSFDQLFLGFGAGMNPFIATPAAGHDLEHLADQILLPAKMNAAQDCMVPNFYVVHESLLPRLIPILKRKVAAMKFGANTDPSADYTELGLTKDLTKVETYRTTYARNLLNPDAVIDRERRLVSPHLFLFEEDDFSSLLLQEHYSPVFPIVSYRTVEGLKKIVMDSRVQAQAMYAIVEGGPSADPHTNAVERLLQQYRHGVVMNDSLFITEPANVPFGGLGQGSSLVHTTRKRPDGSIVINVGHHPVLVSTQAFTYFGTVSTPERQPLRSRAAAQAALRATIELADADPATTPDISAAWRALQHPLRENRRTGLHYLREVIAAEGLFRVLPGGFGDSSLADLEFFFGSPLIVPNADGSRDSRWGTGVAIHPSAIGASVPSLNGFRGRVNPHLGRGYLLALYDNNKKREAELVEAVKPGMMAHTETYVDLVAANRLDARLATVRQRAESAIQAVIHHGPHDTERNEELRLAVEAWMTLLFESVQREFPEGAFFKNFGEFATADLGTQITSFGSNPRHIAAQFIRRLRAAAGTGSSETYHADSFQERMGEDPWEMGTRFINTLLVRPKDLLVQGRVPIARTELGFPMEFRVDFLDGEAVTSNLRFSHEYYPEEAGEAARQLTEFFKAAPPELRHLAGGADVALLNDGRWVFIEFNKGGNSGGLWPQYFPVRANEFIAELTQQPTPFLGSLEQMYRGGLAAQRAYLASLKVEKELWWKATLEDFSRIEAARWIRNRLLDEFRRGVITEERAEEVLSHLKQLLEGVATGENDDFEKLYAGAENFVRRKLLFAPLPPVVAKSTARSASFPPLGGASPTASRPLTARAMGNDRRTPFSVTPRSGTTRRAGELQSDRHDVPGWAFQWMRADEDLAPASQMLAYLMPAVEKLVQTETDAAVINSRLEALFQAGNAVVGTFAADDGRRYEPVTHLRAELRRRGLED